jgi:hypothetical protein
LSAAIGYGNFSSSRQAIASLPRAAVAAAGRRIRFCVFLHNGSRMNRFERQPTGAVEARVEYHDGDFRVIRPGAFVRCAVTGLPIPLDELRYWSVDRQEAYVNPEAVLRRLGDVK